MRPGHTVSEPEPSRPGSVLRAEREALGVTVREVSETLNLSVAIIEAIEADDHARLPGPVFARGYLRAYARLLELEPEPLVAQYPRPPDLAPPRGVPSEPAVWEWIRERPALVLGAAAGGAGLLLVLLAIWLWPGGETEGAEPGAGVGPVAATAADDSTASSYAEDTSAGTGTSPASMEVTAAGETVAAASETGSVRRITETGDDRLRFTFSDDCWVEIHSATGDRLYGDLSPGGTELTLVGEGPFRILLGYAPGAQLTFNGEPLSLAPHTRNNVATFVLGQ